MFIDVQPPGRETLDSPFVLIALAALAAAAIVVILVRRSRAARVASRGE